LAISTTYERVAQVSEANGSAGDPEGYVGDPEEHPARPQDARELALVKLHEASTLLSTVGDIAGVRAVHGAMGVLLEVRGDAADRATREVEVAPVVELAAERSRRAG
jgi:hypothetical protein